MGTTFMHHTGHIYANVIREYYLQHAEIGNMVIFY